MALIPVSWDLFVVYDIVDFGPGVAEPPIEGSFSASLQSHLDALGMGRGRADKHSIKVAFARELIEIKNGFEARSRISIALVIHFHA